MLKEISLLNVIILYAISIFIVIYSKFIDTTTNYLSLYTKENGLYEILSVIFLLSIFVYGLIWIYKNHKKVHKLISISAFLFSILCFLAAMEEISWGQQLFHFTSSTFFQKYNHQHETNLHNLIPASIFSSLIYFCVYSFYVFLPLLLKLAKNRYKFILPIIKYLPTYHITLIVLFASSFQVYFYDDFGVYFDFFTLIVGFVLLAYTLTKDKAWNKYTTTHYIVVSFSCLLFIIPHSIFNYFNAQYEIREMFIILATLLYFQDLLKRFKQEVE